MRPNRVRSCSSNDLVVPGGGAVAAALDIARARPGCRLLFMSGYTDEATLEEAEAPQNQPFLAKQPYHRDRRLHEGAVVQVQRVLMAEGREELANRNKIAKKESEVFFFASLKQDQKHFVCFVVKHRRRP